MGRPLTNCDGAALGRTVRPTLGHEEGLVGVACTACCRAVHVNDARDHCSANFSENGVVQGFTHKIPERMLPRSQPWDAGLA